ncbi:MAG: GspH/FimT family pseudopilin [Proteobacteria bacterium]|nr:GspH/FimT family pseudopilin [Pseudomonadota bacterium]
MLSKRQIGFTLIELVTTLAVSTMLIAMAVPGVNTFLMNSRQSSGVNNLVSAMHLARSTAITKNTRITVCVSSDGEDCDNSDWNQGWIVFADADADQTVDPGEIILGAGAGVTGLTIESTEFSKFFMYRPNGRVMNATVNANSGEFIVCDSRGDEHVRVIIVDSAGRPRLSETRSDGSAPSCS